MIQDTSPSAIKARRAMMDAVAALRKRHDERKSVLWSMDRAQLRELANDYMLPQDLHRPSLIENILKKEFPVR